MFNKQLKANIAELDLQIRKLQEELNKIKKDSKYEIKMDKLEALTELRVKLAKSAKDTDTSSEAVMELDKQIEELTKAVGYLERDEIYAAKLKKLEDLTNVRVQLADCKVKESHAPAIISAVAGIGLTVLVLHYEKTDVITSKAFGMASKLFRGI